jgi:signal transduction histidine kinase
MIVLVIQGAALLIQCASAFFAVRLIRITNRYDAWLLITVSIMLIVPRRTIAFGRLLSGDLSQPLESSVLLESILLLAISLAQAVGIFLIVPLFRSITDAQRELRETNADIERRVTERTSELAEQHDQLEEAFSKLRQTESLRDNLTHMIVHDLRIPLTSIYGFLETLGNSEGDRLSDDGRDYLKTAVESTRNLTDMVNSLLDVSRMESGRMNLDVTDWDPVRATSDLLERFKPVYGGRKVTLDAPKASLTVAADADLIRRVIENLLGNALKFTAEDAHIQVSVKSHDDKLRVSVADNGPGIPPEYREMIFEKFGQIDPDAKLRPRSTGLGLTFCKLAVEAHGGRIGVDTEVHGGSTFWFEIPLRRRAARSVKAAGGADHPTPPESPA